MGRCENTDLTWFLTLLLVTPMMASALAASTHALFCDAAARGGDGGRGAGAQVGVGRAEWILEAVFNR
jgi:hypothetical protein